MTSDNRTTAEIERDIEEERARLSDNLETLQDTFSAETIVREIGNQFRNHGGDISRSIANSVKDNPIALTLTGVGLAWMILGGRSYTDNRWYERSATDYDRRQRFEDDRRLEPYPIPAGSRRSQTDFGETAWAIREREHDDGQDGPGIGERIADAKDRAVDAVSDAGDRISKTVSDTSNSVKDAGARTKATARRHADTAQASVDGLYRRLSSGTENLSDAARERVVAARREALIARERLRTQARRQARNAADLYEQQPLVAGALALAVGAAVGAAIPRTDAEDELMGEQSDALFREAERIYREERDKAARVAEATVDEAKTVAKEVKREMDDKAPAGQTAAQAAGKRAKAAAERVTKKAGAKAKQEKLGSPKS